MGLAKVKTKRGDLCWSSQLMGNSKTGSQLEIGSTYLADTKKAPASFLEGAS